MSYLLDKKNKNKRYRNIFLGIVILFLFIYFRTGIAKSFGTFANTVFKPFVMLGDNIGSNIADMNFYFKSKKTLSQENEILKKEVESLSLEILNTKYLTEETEKLRNIFKNVPMDSGKDFILANILAKPNRSLYDTLLIDMGQEEGIGVGDMVFAMGNIPIGKIDTVYSHSSKVTLFSTSKEKTDVVVGKDLFMQVIGRGGGNFEMILPRDFVLDIDTMVSLPGSSHAVLGVVETIISDPRDAYQKALIVSPVNIQEIRLVQIRK